MRLRPVESAFRSRSDLDPDPGPDPEDPFLDNEPARLPLAPLGSRSLGSLPSEPQSGSAARRAFAALPLGFLPDAEEKDRAALAADLRNSTSKHPSSPGAGRDTPLSWASRSTLACRLLGQPFSHPSPTSRSRICFSAASWSASVTMIGSRSSTSSSSPSVTSRPRLSAVSRSPPMIPLQDGAPHRHLTGLSPYLWKL